ncbi:MAG: methionine--tRNA ligase [Candidatus Harrisonbacteria bacterium RIFCSPHIGHO2_01_FULL_44_13]|uniref:methionine--tRNA ligase n=1 Tax=Candidatus Harrisonbacteria bacterium RIFCSPLOWO2_01_FULL_44_18 TaxID=1798407 RepID=A0A1G1ZKK1_9BACT|nr:MAG: methionine--tRNA ligase [Candidatus Harrisonbacteria bacterium RIFCSPHIGHO2_01_FULL_44_13]OGY65153.1 MAG: methionine--tRNA ligase [Candidatus Harrisonbacteria bacterium RIFCSPLOWO2_01_FULL_44_18]
MKKFYITTSIVYVNAPPHVGFALESIQADVLARYHRQKGDEVFFLTGADEHGAKIARAAEAVGKDFQLFVDEIAAKVKKLKDVLNLSWDDFIRTTDKKRHWPGAQKLWRDMAAAGDLYRRKYRGLYCVGHEAFVTEKDLIDGKCRDHQKEPEVIEEENWFFRLSKYQKKIESSIKKNKLRIIPEGRRTEVLSFIKEGLEDVSFSRPRKDLSWGISVPDDETSTMYVWCDALANYISAIGYGQQKSSPPKADPPQAEKFTKWWPADIHLIGKDILRFHALLWPAMLLSAKLPLPKNIFVHGHLTVDGQKMSKSVGNVVDPFELVAKYGIDPARYYLLREIPSGEDGDFSYKKLKERYNGDLANGLGNFAARVLTLAEKLGEIKVDLKSDVDKAVAKKIKAVQKKVDEKITEFKLHEALAEIWDLIAFGDKYVNEKKPWNASLSVNEKARTIFNLIAILDNVAAMLSPFLPETSKKITESIHWLSKNTLKIKKSAMLFPRI